MSRPRKHKNVCSLPKNNRFRPLGRGKECGRVVMSVEEYETIRLIDLEGLNQEESAAQMGIARSTVQSIYYEARKKMAELLVEGKELCIYGGDYRLCEGMRTSCRWEQCCKNKEKCRYAAREQEKPGVAAVN